MRVMKEDRNVDGNSNGSSVSSTPNNRSHEHKVFVGNLSWDVTEAQFRDWAEAEGVDVARVEILKDKDTMKPRGFGFLTVCGNSTVESASEALNGKELMGRKVTVNRAAPRPPKVRQ